MRQVASVLSPGDTLMYPPRSSDSGLSSTVTVNFPSAGTMCIHSSAPEGDAFQVIPPVTVTVTSCPGASAAAKTSFSGDTESEGFSGSGASAASCRTVIFTGSTPSAEALRVMEALRSVSSALSATLTERRSPSRVAVSHPASSGMLCVHSVSSAVTVTVWAGAAAAAKRSDAGSAFSVASGCAGFSGPVHDMFRASAAAANKYAYRFMFSLF